MARVKICEQDVERFRRTNIGKHLTDIAKDFQKRALAKFIEHGHAGLQPAHTAVIANLGLEGSRLTDLARRASMTKQGMGQLVDEVQRLGYVERMPDPTDSRAKIVRFSERGRRLVSHGVEIGDQIQSEYARLIGGKRLRLLRDTLEDLNQGLRGRRPPLLRTARPRVNSRG